MIRFYHPYSYSGYSVSLCVLFSFCKVYGKISKKPENSKNEIEKTTKP